MRDMPTVRSKLPTRKKDNAYIGSIVRLYLARLCVEEFPITLSVVVTTKKAVSTNKRVVVAHHSDMDGHYLSVFSMSDLLDVDKGSTVDVNLAKAVVGHENVIGGFDVLVTKNTSGKGYVCLKPE